MADQTSFKWRAQSSKLRAQSRAAGNDLKDSSDMTSASRRIHRASRLPNSESKVLRQPQDGAVDPGSRIAAMTSHLQNQLFHEPEDARLTGGTRSLMRRVLGLNVTKGLRKSADAASVAAKQAHVA